MPKYQTGYGDGDKKLSERLAKAPTKAEADKIAKADGHKDAKDAADWLKSRTGF